MPEDLNSIKAKVSQVIQTSTDFIATAQNGEMEQSIREALSRYSKDVPREIVADVAGDGATYDLALPATWSDGFSRVVRVEYPAGERIATYLDPRDYTIYRTSSAVNLRLLSSTPGTGQSTRVTFTALHTLDDLDSATVTTIPDYHTFPFVNLAASRCLLKLAPRFTHEQETTLNADAVDRNSKGDLFRRLSGTLERDYEEQVGATGAGRAALTIVNWDARIHRGIGGLTHPRGSI